MGNPFREQIAWPAAHVIARGADQSVEFADCDSGSVLKTISLGDDYFGGFGEPDADMLCVLGWRNVVAIARTLEILWVSENVAIDGITWRGRDGNRIKLCAEMDPPGGWVDVELDATTGRKCP